MSDRDGLVEEMATAILRRRGFAFYADPMEGGQDAYDISLDAIADAEAALTVAEAAIRADEREACAKVIAGARRLTRTPPAPGYRLSSTPPRLASRW